MPEKENRKDAIGADTMSSEERLEEELCRFFDVGTLEDKPNIIVSARKASGDIDPDAAQGAWCYRAECSQRVRLPR
jgi:hypothetical protein